MATYDALHPKIEVYRKYSPRKYGRRGTIGYKGYIKKINAIVLFGILGTTQNLQLRKLNWLVS